jgi:hypothetical protein
MMNLNLSSNSAELTLTQITKEHVSTVSEMLSYDITKIGYAQGGKVTEFINPATGNPYTMISYADSNTVTFNGDVDNDGNIDTISWELTDNEVATTENPNDLILVRKQGTEETKIKVGVTRFSISYFDTYGEQKANRMNTPITGPDLEIIKQIEIELELQSRETISYRPGDDGRYISSAWQKRFTPRNLE